MEDFVTEVVFLPAATGCVDDVEGFVELLNRKRSSMVEKYFLGNQKYYSTLLFVVMD
jgi:hypothetical protein